MSETTPTTDGGETTTSIDPGGTTTVNTDFDFDFSTVDTGTVLIVDDEPGVADLHTYRVEKEYTAVTAYNGKEAVEKMRDDIDVVLLDRRMPELTGDEVIEEFREEGYDAQVVMVTAVEPSDDLVTMKCNDYLTKPIGENVLRDAVKHQLRIRRRGEITRALERLERKRETFEDVKDSTELQEFEPYQKILAAISELENAREELSDEIDAY